MPALQFTASDGHTYYLARQNSRRVIRNHGGLRFGEVLHEYWGSPDDDTRRCYVAQDGKRHVLD